MRRGRRHGLNLGRRWRGDHGPYLHYFYGHQPAGNQQDNANANE
jgi:hypothetical protein